MALTLKLDAIEDLPRTPASDVKKFGWRALMKAIASKGKVVVTNHNEPQAVILSMEAYDAILEAFRAANASDEAALEALRDRFDERLASLQSRDANERLKKVMRTDAKLSGKVKAGASH
jgi:prevent-host-death family protein